MWYKTFRETIVINSIPRFKKARCQFWSYIALIVRAAKIVKTASNAEYPE